MDNLLLQIKNLGKKYKSISKIVLFGSRARGDFTEKSDYDIAVFCADENVKFQFMNDVDELPTLHKFDVIFIEKRHMDKAIYQNIKRDGVIIMSKFSDKLENFVKAVERLEIALNDAEKYEIESLKDAVIQRFEFTTELSWKATREYLLEQGETDINSPKPVMRTAFRVGLITDEQTWISLLEDRNITSHVYDEEQADEVFIRIKDKYINSFKALAETLKQLTMDNE